jgi:hypothetical protein
MPGSPIAIAEILTIVLVVALTVMQLSGVVSAAMVDRPAWNAAGHSKATWVILQLVVPFVGALIYFIVIRPRLRRHRPGVAFDPSGRLWLGRWFVRDAAGDRGRRARSRLPREEPRNVGRRGRERKFATAPWAARAQATGTP